jgi:hypothetical protein
MNRATGGADRAARLGQLPDRDIYQNIRSAAFLTAAPRRREIPSSDSVGKVSHYRHGVSVDGYPDEFGGRCGG